MKGRLPAILRVKLKNKKLETDKLGFSQALSIQLVISLPWEAAEGKCLARGEGGLGAVMDIKNIQSDG